MGLNTYPYSPFPASTDQLHKGDNEQIQVEIDEINGDIVSLENDLTTLDNEVNGDATVYPYADVITIEDAIPANLADCSVKIEPVQSGSGDPSPTNIRPITGHTEASVEVTDGDETTKTYTIALGDTIYGGTVDFDSGVMTVDDVKKVFDGSEDETWTTRTTQSGYNIFEIANSDTRSSTSQMQVGLCNEFPWNVDLGTDRSYRYYNVMISIRYDGLTLAEFKEWLSSHELEVTLPLATPTTIQLTPQQIQLLKGQNTLTASTGQISVTVNGVSGSIGAVQEQVNELVEDVETITSVKSATAGTNVTIDGGGYITVGNMVIVNIEFTADDDIASNTVLLNLPNELLTNTPINIYDKSTYDMLSKGRIYNGKLMASEQIVSSNSYYVAGVYIKS